MQDENMTPDEPQADEPAAEQPAEETPPADESQADEPAAEQPAEETPPADESQADEPAAEQPAEETPPADEPAGEEPADEPQADEPAAQQPAAEQPPAEDARAEAPPAPAPKEAEAKAKDVAPGADLEPIRIEDDRELSAEERARLEAEQEERARREAAAEDGGDDEPVRAGAKVDLPADARVQTTGKRKTSVARVLVTKGGGNLQVNRRDLAEYFPRSYHQTVARQALVTSGYEDQVDVQVRVHGGGVSGQADAVRHGIARALVAIDPELRGELKRRGMLTRDARAKERRKAGLKKARKRPQFSKR